MLQHWCATGFTLFCVMSTGARPKGDSRDVNSVCFAHTPSEYPPPLLHQTKIISPPKFARSKDLNGILTCHDGILSWIWGSEVEVNVWAKSQTRGGGLNELRWKTRGGIFTSWGGGGCVPIFGLYNSLEACWVHIIIQTIIYMMFEHFLIIQM